MIIINHEEIQYFQITPQTDLQTAIMIRREVITPIEERSIVRAPEPKWSYMNN